MSGQDVLRSVHIEKDLEHPERLAHYHPTTKSVAVLRRVFPPAGSAATLVIAAYGSGKSLAAGVGLMASANTAEQQEVLRGLAARLAGVDDDLAKSLLARIRDGARGHALVLSGYVEDLPRTIARQAGHTRRPRSLSQALQWLEAHVRDSGADRVAVVWDEFGRHLEALVSEGRASEVVHVQEFAEWAVRVEGCSASLALLLHQSLLSYASRLTQSARTTWKKVEGRFETLRFVEDSREVYGLIADVVTSQRRQAPPAPRGGFARQARESLANGLFEGFEDADQLAELLKRAAPLSPAVLHLLPLLSARVAQNERTLFSFLGSTPLDRPIGPSTLYHYFAEAMRTDSGLGGTQQRYLETETALSAAGDETEEAVLCAACVMNLGNRGERRRLPRARLAFAVASAGYGHRATEQAIDRLLERKLLLHRLRKDDISVWHGADIDLRARCEEESARLAVGFDLEGFLEQQVPAGFERPLRHNVDRSVNRYFAGRYVRAVDLLREGDEHEAAVLPPGADGRILYALCESADEAKALRRFARSEDALPEGVVLAVPRRVVELQEGALELAALLRMREDQELIGADPLVRPEVEELAAVAREHLVLSLDRLTSPSFGESQWFHRGRDLGVGPALSGSEALSRVAESRFSLTPKVANEQIVRHHVSRAMANARKKCVLGILERSGQPHLGFEGATSADASVYRTLLERTGLYGVRDGSWRYASPEEINDPALARVWETTLEFVREPTPAPKALSEWVERLIAPPFGVRPGMLPVLLAAALRAGLRCLAVRRDGRYIADVLPSTVDEMCERHEHYSIEALDTSAPTLAYLEAIRAEFAPGEDAVETDRVRAVYNAVTAWRRQLPEAALATRSLGPEVAPMQRALRSTEDPVDLIFRHFPELAGAPLEGDGAAVVEGISRLRRRLESVVEGYTQEAIETARLCFGADTGEGVREAAARWGGCLAGAPVSDALGRGLIRRAADALDARHSDASFVRALSYMMLGLDFEHWNDATAREFKARLGEKVEACERSVFAAERPDPSAAPLMQRRIRDLMGRLTRAIGRDDAVRIMDEIRTEQLND